MLHTAVRTVLIIAVTGVVAAGMYLAPGILHRPTHGVPPPPTPDAGEKVTRSGAGLLIPSGVAERMGLKIGTAAEQMRPRRMPPFQGCLALPPESLARARSRFAGEVVWVTPLKAGAAVKEGDLLAVVWSKDLGEKKSELADAVSRLELDTVTLRRLRDLHKEGGTAERSVWEAERNAAAGRIAVQKAERTLRAWRLTPAEIDAIKKPGDGPRTEEDDWARVEVKAPRGGTIEELNVHVNDIIDTTTDLFKIADLCALSFWAHVYEEDLPLLSLLPRPAPCKVSLPSRPGVSFESTLERVGAVIDPSQHTALITGRVPNPGGALKAGQFVTVSVEVPARPGEVSVPAEAVVEDGITSIVFVPMADVYTPVKVTVLRRFSDEIHVKAEPGGVKPGQHVVTAGSLMLKAALDALPGQAEKK